MTQKTPPKGRRNKSLSETLMPGTETQKGHLRLVPSAPEGAKKTRIRTAKDPETGMTTKQEAFCQGVTSGKSLTDAYRAAYDCSNMTDKSIHENACRAFNSVKITARLVQINEEAKARRRMLATSDADLALSVLREMAEKADTDASKIRAAELLAKSAGVFTEQVEITDKTDRSEADIEEAIRAKLARLNLTG